MQSKDIVPALSLNERPVDLAGQISTDGLEDHGKIGDFP
jgi:hypothetical protein